MSIDPKYYSEDVKIIKKIEFSIFTNKEIKSYSSVSNDPFGINLPESYENYEPKKGGLVDLRLGTCDIYLNCTTCGLNSIECPGHFGHTDLAEPVFHYGFFPYLKIILQCICLQCSKILVEKIEVVYKKLVNKKPEARFKEIKNITKNINYCYTCGTPVGKIKKEEKESTASLRLILERDVGIQLTDEKTGDIKDIIKKITKILTPRDCYNILRNLSDTECYILGFNPKYTRPEDLIIQKFPIPPTIIRPTAKIDFLQASTMEDSLTLKIADIINANLRVRSQLYKEVVSNELSTYNQDISNLLQFHIITYYDNESLSLPRSEFKTGGKPTKSISERIKAKEGRVRSNLMGKRVDFSARSVITPDPYINIDEVGIPKKIAIELTIPEEVTPYNIKQLTELVRNGRDIYPGANFVFRTIYKDGKTEIQKIDLKYRKKSIKLNIGDIVERHSINGDYVLFNRQPTLHKPSMMGHKIHVLNRDDINTFRMSVSICNPYNADFDGDEMNIHMAQSVQARNELKRIANVKYQIIGAKDSNPIIGCVQDSLSGLYLLTKLNNKLPGSIISNFLCNTSSETKYNIDKNKVYTGHEIFSYIIPDGINNIVSKNNKIIFEINNGIFKLGTLDKSTLSTVKNSIIHFIWDKYGPDKTQKFIDDAQKLALEFLNYKGFTIGIKDCIIEEKIENQILYFIENKILEYKILLTQYENDIDQIDTSIIETNLSAELNSFSTDIGNMIFKNLDPLNNLFVCIDSKARGNIMNLQHIMGCVGQKSIEGSRIKKKIENRTMCIFHKDDDTPEARGFIKNSYLTGLTTYEFFYDAMAGREGLIDTAIKSVTWETPIIIIDKNQPKYIEIGRWINDLMKNNKQHIEYNSLGNTEILDVSDIYIPTTDYKGNISWGEIKAVTRHDPSELLYKITTEYGRSVIVTAAKSLLIWDIDNHEFKELLSSEIRIGDYVPSTVMLPEYNITKEFIEISDYISYINTNYNQIIIINDIDNYICCCKKNYTINSCKQLTAKHLAINNNKFMLNYMNGIFIGIVLAKGIIKNNNLYINIYHKSEKYLLDYIIEWLAHYKYKPRSSYYNIYFSSIISTFIYNFCNYSGIPIIPKETFIGPTDFILGILNGYFSGCGYINSNSINIYSKSEEFINSISMLCARIGIIGKLSNYNKKYYLKIEDIWLKKFVKQIKLISKAKHILLQKIIFKKKIVYHHLIYNNVLLDKIIDIKIISSDLDKYKKVYDLTIPSTYNFTLANGLNVRDTAKTGYIQRQLIKGLEDLIIKYDNTNRNSKNVIIQYTYGDNGIDQTYQTELKINLISLNNKEIEQQYGFTQNELQQIEKNHKLKKIEEFNNNYITKIKEFRDNLRKIQTISSNNYKTLEEKYMLPVNLFRLTQDYSKHKINLELDPIFIVNEINKLLNSTELRLLPGLKTTDKYLLDDDRALKYLLEIALNDYLCPKKCIFEYGLSKIDFLDLLNNIKLNFIKALVQPGEMVGIITAQSIGEPSSQMSTYNESTKIIKKNKLTNELTMISTKIGKFCDNIISNNRELTYNTGHIDSVETELDTLEDEYYIIGVTSEEKTKWNKISHVSRHPINGKLIKIRTKSGRIVHTTMSHSHLIRKNQTIIPIKGSEMNIGMRIPVTKHIDNTFIQSYIKINNIEYELNYSFGFYIGQYIANKNIDNSQYKILNTILDSYIFYKCKKTNKQYKHIPNFTFIAPNEFKVGLLKAYIDIKGIFKHEIVLIAESIQLIKDIALLLCYFDIFCSIKNKLIKQKLIIPCKYCLKYNQVIGTNLHSDKLNTIINNITYCKVTDKLDRINGLNNIIQLCNNKLNLKNYCNINKSLCRTTINNYINIYEKHKDKNKILYELNILKQAISSHIIWDEIIEIIPYTTNKKHYVYDFTVPYNETFMTDYGIIVHNTLNTKHSAGVASKSTTNMGVSRIEELLHYSKDIKTPQMIVYFDPLIADDRSKVNKISSYFTHLTIRDLIDSAEIFYYIDGDNLISNKIKEDKVVSPFFVNNQKIDLSALPFIFRIKCNMEKMHDKETTLLDIKTKFISHWAKNFNNLKNMKKIEKDIFNKISRCAILSNNDMVNQIIHIRFNMSTFNYNQLTDFLKIILNQITLKGIDNINNSDISYERKLSFNKLTGDIDISKEYIVYTEGINLEKIKYIKGINKQLTTCNNIHIIYKLYGIEAARQILINEFNATFNAGGSKSINQNHMSVLIDMMTHTGSITSIDRHGLNKIDSDPISKASFEKTMDHFLNASIFNDTDHLESVSSRIMLGRVIPGGTGYFELLLDTDKLENSEYSKNETGGRITFTKLEEEQLFKDILKFGFSKHDFFLPLNIYV